MSNKTAKIVLITFALTTILWVTVFAYIMNVT